MSSRRSKSIRAEKELSVEEQQQKISEVRKLIEPLPSGLQNFCSDASISRYLRARNWNAEKAKKMLNNTLKWTLEYRPDMIRWEDVAHEAETGKIYRADYLDKSGRAVLVMRPGFQNTSSAKGQIKYLVYCMENAILNLAPDQEQMVWLIDFQGWSMGSVSVKVTRETAHVLQDYYPERLAYGILYNPPKIFESFWKVVKPFLEHKTYKKVKFVYSDDPESQKIMLDLFDMDKLESAFGGGRDSDGGFNFQRFAKRMKEDDHKRIDSLSSSRSGVVSVPLRTTASLSDAESEDSSYASSSSGAASPKNPGGDEKSKNSRKGKMACKASVGSGAEIHMDAIQVKESV